MSRRTFIAILAAFLIFDALIILTVVQPDRLEVERRALIRAPVAAIFPLVSDFHSWEKWSPWAKLDPQMQVTYEGTPGALGSSYEWNGNDEVGAGKMALTEVDTNKSLRIALDFLRPFKASHVTTFTFEPTDGATLVSWKMTGKQNFLAKAMHLVMNMDAMIGKDFEKGLEALKQTAEATPAKE